MNLTTLQQFFQSRSELFTLDPIASLADSLVQDFDANERVAAGFLLGQVDFGGGSVLAGVRIEQTSGDYYANELLYDNGTFTRQTRPASGETSYTDVLPGIHLNLTPRQNLVLRFAVTRTLRRPSYADLAPIRALDDLQNEDGTYVGSLSSGSPDLEPFESTNLDASFEYYLGSGQISVAPFYKRIDNAIYELDFQELGVTYNGRFYERLALRVRQRRAVVPLSERAGRAIIDRRLGTLRLQRRAPLRHGASIAHTAALGLGTTCTGGGDDCRPDDRRRPAVTPRACRLTG